MMMKSNPMIVLNHENAVPPYEQINQQIRLLIASSQLLPLTLLPSVRQLAGDLGIAPNTVVRAYTELEHDGWVITAARKGVMVAEHPPVVSVDERRQRLRSAVTDLLVTTHQLGVSINEIHAEIDRQGREII